MKIHLRQIALGFCMTLLLGGCSSPALVQYADQKPELDLSQFFSGTIQAYGIFTDRSGEVKKRFTVLIQSNWEMVQGKKVGTLDESFEYSDGTTQKRIWRLTETAPGQFTGTADDVVGVAKGESAGNALHWAYTLALPVDGTTATTTKRNGNTVTSRCRAKYSSTSTNAAKPRMSCIQKRH